MLSFKEKSSVQCGTTNQAITKGCPYVLPISTKVVAPSSRIFLTGRSPKSPFRPPIKCTQLNTTKEVISLPTWTSEISSGTACATASPLSRRRANLFFFIHWILKPNLFQRTSILSSNSKFSNLHTPIIR